MFEKEIAAYEQLRTVYQQEIGDKLSSEQYTERNQVLFSAYTLSLELTPKRPNA